MPTTTASTEPVTKASSLTAKGRRPSTRTRSSFSRVAAATWPARERSNQVTSAKTTTSSTSATQ